MNTTGLVLIGAGAIGLYALSQNASANGGGGGTGSPAPGSADQAVSSENPFANIMESVKSFLTPASAPNSGLSTQTPSDTLLSKKAASTVSETPLFALNSADPFDKTSASSLTRFTADPNSGGGGVYDRYAQQSISNEVAIQRNNPFSIVGAETKKSSSIMTQAGFLSLGNKALPQSIAPSVSQGTSVGSSSSVSTSSNKSNSSNLGTTTKKAASTSGVSLGGKAVGYTFASGAKVKSTGKSGLY